MLSLSRPEAQATAGVVNGQLRGWPHSGPSKLRSSSVISAIWSGRIFTIRLGGEYRAPVALVRFAITLQCTRSLMCSSVGSLLLLHGGAQDQQKDHARERDYSGTVQPSMVRVKLVHLICSLM